MRSCCCCSCCPGAGSLAAAADRDTGTHGHGRTWTHLIGLTEFKQVQSIDVPLVDDGLELLSFPLHVCWSRRFDCKGLAFLPATLAPCRRLLQQLLLRVFLSSSCQSVCLQAQQTQGHTCSRTDTWCLSFLRSFTCPSTDSGSIWSLPSSVCITLMILSGGNDDQARVQDSNTHPRTRRSASPDPSSLPADSPRDTGMCAPSLLLHTLTRRCMSRVKDTASTAVNESQQFFSFSPFGKIV